MEDFKNLQETQLSSQPIFDGDVLHIFKDTIRLPNGKQATREYTVHHGAVCVLPLLENGDVLLEHQFRYPMGEVITEECRVSPELVHGAYAKSKAAANKKVLLAAEKGLDAGIVYPSGIIVPGDRGMGSMTVMLRSFLRGRLPAGVCGGYDFVDVRDAAAGAVSCADSGRPGEGYILSGRYASIKELLTLVGRLSGRRAPGLFLPRRLAGLAAPIFERRSIRRGEKPFFTPYSISVLGSNGNFSHKKASDELGYSPRDLSDTLSDTLRWLSSLPI